MCLAIPARVVELLPHSLATVEVGGVYRSVSLDLVDGVKVGDHVIVHVGFAIQKLDEGEALETLRLFEEMARAYETSNPSIPPLAKGGWRGILK